MQCKNCGRKVPEDVASCPYCGRIVSGAELPRVPPGDERVYYTDDDVTVTNVRTVVFGETYAIQDITTAELTRQAPNKTQPVALVVLGVLFLLPFLANREATLWLLVSAVLITGGIAVWGSAKEQHIARVETTIGEVDILRTRDEGYASQIVSAINQALLDRG